VKLDYVKQVKDQYEDRLMELDCVQGVGIRDSKGDPVITVYVDSSQGPGTEIPKELDDVPVVVEESGSFEAY
jgi:hypothetical protein